MDSKLLVKYVIVLNKTETWLQMFDSLEDCNKIIVENSHVERWFFNRHDKGDSLIIKEKEGDELPLFLRFAGFEPLKIN